MPKLLKRILGRLHREFYIPLDILLKSRKYRNDRNYVANGDIAKGFRDRLDLTGDDTELLKRIVASYQKASRDLNDYPDVFRPSNEWLPIYRHNLGAVISVLEQGDISKLDKIYRNFWRESCSTGLVGLHGDMKKAFFGDSIGLVNKTLYLNDAIHRLNLWKELSGNRYGADSLLSPMIGNPYGYYVDGKFIKSGADYQHYYAARILGLIGEKEGRKVVAEIGAGFGGMAYYLIRDSKNTTYVDFDLPENLALTTYYLLKAFPEKKVLLYGEAEFGEADLGKYDIVLMPNFQFDKLPTGACDLFFNSYSLAEMSPETIGHYVSQMANLIVAGGYFFHVNHTKNSLVSARDFPIPEGLELISEEFAAWNLGRNSNMDEYEFVYKRK